jgi:hypothetical protein
MWDGRDRQGRMSRETLTLIVAGLVLLFAIVVWGPWNSPHVAINPGPSGTPGSTAIDQTPPPAAGPSGTTSGAVR